MSEENKLQGEIKVISRGIGYFPIEGEEVDLEIQQSNLNGALNGDTVLIEELQQDVRGRKQGKVKEIIKRKKTFFVGTIDSTDQGLFLIPDDKKMYMDIHIPNNSSLEAKKGDKAKVELTEWADSSKTPEGKVIKVIGKAGEHNAEMQSIVYEKGFEVDFPADVEAEADAWKEQFENEDHLKDRKDFRNTTTFTIDPDDAKDFDDAISVKKLESGDFEIGVHIADVSHFVVPGTALDREARERGTSIYLVDRTIPMLPEVLSNDLCSLNPNVEKYAFSAVFVIDQNAKVKERWFGKTLIKSDKRFTYEEAQEVLENNEGLHVEELNILNSLAKKLREEKFKKGAIDFETEEVKFVLDENGKPIKVYKKERKDTHKLVEDFMLLANREVAKYMYNAYKSDSRAAFVYRIHDTPNRERIINLATFVKALGFELENTEGETTALDIAEMLRLVDGSPAEDLIKTAAVRSMSKAVYSTSNIGHFGLAFDYYTHFTSPIRRYPDLLVHRLIYRFLTNGKIEQNEMAKYQKFSEEASLRELDAAEAERASIKYKQVEYMKEHIGEEFDATISGVSEWGIYVEETETKAEGMVKLRDMEGDFFELNEKMYAVVGKSTGKKYSLGDKVRVKLVTADEERKTLDFKMV